VNGFALRNPAALSTGQLAGFARRYANARPALDGREIDGGG
jgi:hypothetical protein